jgi:hypothetical protein
MQVSRHQQSIPTADTHVTVNNINRTNNTVLLNTAHSHPSPQHIITQMASAPVHHQTLITVPVSNWSPNARYHSPNRNATRSVGISRMDPNAFTTTNRQRG